MTVQYHLFGNSGRVAMRLWLGVGPRSNLPQLCLIASTR